MGMLAGSGGGAPVSHPKPHPAVVAAQHAADLVSAQVSHMAAQHAATVVHHVASVHAHGHAPAHQATPATFAHYVAQQHPEVQKLLAGPLGRAVAASMQDPANYGGPMTWNGSQWVPAAVANQNDSVAPGQAPYGAPSDAGNNSIASHGGGNGILGYLLGLS